MAINNFLTYYRLKKSAKAGDAQAQQSLAFYYYKKNKQTKAFVWMEKSALSGNHQSEYHLHLYYKQGVGCKVDLVKSLEYLVLSASAGYPLSEKALAQCYFDGDTVQKNLDRAFYWLEKAEQDGESPQLYFYKRYFLESAKEDFSGEPDLVNGCKYDCPYAEFEAGRRYAYGVGTANNWFKALFWLRISGQVGYLQARQLLALVYQQGSEAMASGGSTKSVAAAQNEYQYGKGVSAHQKLYKYWQNQVNETLRFERECLEDFSDGCKLSVVRKAIDGDSEEQCELGQYYQEGTGTKKNLQKMTYWYFKAASNGSTRAKHSLGWCYAGGVGLKQNYEKACYWYSQATSEGHAGSKHNLGRLYLEGRGVERDAEKGISLITQAAEQGDLYAQQTLGACYRDGNGVEQDYQRAYQWYKMAAERGSTDAQCTLGTMYEKGYGVTKNATVAFSWYKKSAAGDNATAARNMGLCYEYGRGTEKDLSKAKHWYTRAISLGKTNAKQDLARVTQQLESATD